MNANETARTLYPDMPVHWEIISELRKAAETEDLISVIMAAFKLGYRQYEIDHEQ